MSAYKKSCYFRGKEAEKRFFSLVGGRQSSHKEDRHLHIDGYMPTKSGKEVAVDVKSFRSSHREGFVLVEFLNTQGKAGWCSKGSHAQVIALEFERGFILVDKEKMRIFSQQKIFENSNTPHDEVWRQNNISPSQGLYRLCGRESDRQGNPRKDVFTYIKKADLKELSVGYIPFNK